MCFSCLNHSHQIKDGKTRKCGIDGCEKVQNRLLQKAVKSVELAVNKETNLTSINKTIVRGALQVVPIRVHGKTRSHEDTTALCVTGSSQTWVEQELLERIKLDGEEVTVHEICIHGTSPIQSKRVEVRIGPADSIAADRCTLMVNSHKNLVEGKKEYELRPPKQKYGYLSCILQNTVRLSEVNVKLGQVAFPFICPLAFKIGGANTLWPFKLPLAWALSGLLPTSEKAQC